MHVVPGNVIDAGVAEVVRLFDWRRGLYDHRSVDVARQTVEHADAARPETAPVVVMMMPRVGECRESRTRWRRARTACRARIGQGFARGKDKRDCAERCDKRRSIGHGTHP